MTLLSPDEKRFLDVFLHEATTSLFTGPATKALHENGRSTARSRTWRGLTSRRYRGPDSRLGTPPSRRHRSLGQTGRWHCAETRRSSKSGSSDDRVDAWLLKRENASSNCPKPDEKVAARTNELIDDAGETQRSPRAFAGSNRRKTRH